MLAIDGGEKTFPEGPPGWPATDDDISANINEALTNGSWGKYEAEWTEQLQRQITTISGCENILLCSSGTVAAEIAMRAADVKPDTEVILAAYDFPGNFRAIEAIGARPVIVDVVPNGWVLDPNEIKTAISDNTSAIIVSHLHGQLAHCHEIRELCDQHDIRFIEDVCQTPGATVDGKVVGSFGDVSTYSFGGSKLLSAGRGGAVATNNPDVFQRAKIYCNRGNEAFPLSQLQAAVLLPQLSKLATRNKTRAERASLLVQKTQSVDWLIGHQQSIQNETETAFYKLPWLLADSKSEWTRDELIASFQAEGIAIDVGFRGFTRRSAKRCRHHGSLINSRIAAQQTILLHHPILLESEETIDRLADGILKVATSRN